MRTLVLGVTLLVVSRAPQLKAQTETADVLRQAQELYEQLQIERAVPLLRQILSPAWTFEVTPAQRVVAYTYLGAALDLLGARDSALTYFVGALERDPFTDLDARRFTPAQVALFQRARRLTFAVAARPVTATRVDPRTERATFTVVTTHAASLRVTLRPVDNLTATVLFQDVNEGLREVSWDGLLTGGEIAPPGRYELALFGRSQLLGRSDSARVFFTVAHERAALEDTLPDLGPRELLAERVPADAGRKDLLKGLAVAAAALVASSVVANGQLGHDGRVLAGLVGGTAVTVGVAGLLAARAGRALPANVAENSQRRAARAAANAAVARRNAARIGATVLVITPAAGIGP